MIFSFEQFVPGVHYYIIPGDQFEEAKLVLEAEGYDPALLDSFSYFDGDYFAEYGEVDSETAQFLIDMGFIGDFPYLKSAESVHPYD